MLDSFLKLHNGSDVRGVALSGVEGEEVNLTFDIVKKITASFLINLSKKTGKEVKDLKVGAGHDSRISAEDLKNAVLEGIVSMGAEAFDCGLASTPSMFMSTVFDETNFDGGIMITASHLPFNRNGLKFFSKQGGYESHDIENILTEASKISIPEKNNHNIKKINIIDIYSEFLRKKITDGVGIENPLKGLHIVLDASNGSGGFFAEKVLKPLGADTTGSIFLEPDGKFPNHVPNPENKEAMEAIKKAVLENKADLGIIFDTDVDRAAVVFSNGEEVNRNKIVALASAIVAKDYPNSTVVTDSVTSEQLTDFIENILKMKHHRFKRGYKNVINEALRLNSIGEETPLAIETSGHCAFKENYFLDDGAYLSVKICIEVAKAKLKNESLESILDGLKEPSECKEFRFKINNKDFKNYGNNILKEFEEFAEKQNEFTVVKNSYEGVRVLFNTDSYNGFMLLRMSLHDPQMPFNIESEQEGGIFFVTEKIKPFLNKFEDLDSSNMLTSF